MWCVIIASIDQQQGRISMGLATCLQMKTTPLKSELSEVFYLLISRQRIPLNLLSSRNPPLWFKGMPINGFDLGAACYKTVYENLGLQYQTPEAYTMEKSYRSPGYMRPLAIWSIQHAVDMRHICCNESSLTQTAD